ncbi:MAG: hypothetical protein CVU84_07200 [Firmicutes bacterium HGW-Firmicutes-1]|jgi:N-acetylmuramoyl-L-alanine amidase|nr:MAG: hypothetical protein CVU84_07200 [Firmicutes bacterium HGW-Firmicutes-1]
MKRVMALFFSISILLLQFSVSVFAGETRENFYIEYDGKISQYKSKVVSINIDGEDVVTGEMPAILIDNSTLVPAREVFESNGFNAKVEWNGEKQEVYVSYKDQNIVLKIGSNTAYINNVAVTLEVPARLIRDKSQKNPKTMIPLRFVTENLGYGIEWKQNTYTAMISSPETSVVPEVTPEIPEIPIDDTGKGEALDELNSDKAKRTLPTALNANPITWSSSLTPSDQTLASVITAQDHPVVNITAVDYESDTKNFSIQSSGPISSVVSTFMASDSKYVVDIYNSVKLVNNKTYSDNPIVTAVRTGQQEDGAGKKVTRIVFDVKSTSVFYDLTISEDRKTLNFTMKDNMLNKIQLGQNDKGDFILLTGLAAPDVKAFRLSNPDRIVFDLGKTTTLIGNQSASNIPGQYVVAMRTAQFNSSTTRVVIETDGQADYDVTKVDKLNTLIQINEPSYKNIKYENDTNPMITLEGIGSKIKLDGITYVDKYATKEFIIDLPGNYESVFGTGDIHIDDSIISNIEIQKNSNGNTRLVIHEKSIYVFRLEADSQNIYIKAYKPKEIYSKIIVVDFGHGGHDPGATGNGLKEKDLNLSMGTYLKGYLDSDSSIKVYYTRLDDTFISLQGRTDLANDVEADFFVSVHNNATDSTKANGTETIYFKDDNRAGLNSNELASIIQKKVVSAAGLNSRGIKADNGLYLLRNSKMPATIIEVGFVSNVNDSSKISNPTIQKNVGKAIYEAIVEVFVQYPTGR